MRAVFCIIFIFIGWFNSIAQELIHNGDGELNPPWDGWFQPDTYWNIVPSGTVTPHGGSYFFSPGGVGVTVAGVTTSEAYQNINLTAYATLIDAGTANFTFSGWRRGLSGQLDRAQIIVEYRDASNAVLASYNTGSAMFNAWTNSTDTRNAPIGTRSIRIRLISTRLTGSDNDGYYDDISFKYNPPTCAPPTSLTVIPGTATAFCLGSALTVSLGTVAPANANYYYTWYKNGTAITAASKTYAAYTIPSTIALDAGTYTLRVEDGNTGTATCYKEASVVIAINAPPVAGTILSNQEICSGTAPNPLTGTASTGGVAVKNYKWQSSTISATGPWTPAQAYSTTATGFSPGTLTTTTYYRRMDSSGVCLGVPTTSITITIDAPPVAGSISTNQEICSGTAPNPLTGTASTGGVAVKNYKWQSSTISATGPWTAAQAYSTTATGFSPGTLTTSTYYRRIDSSGYCLGVPTASIIITVDAPPVAGSISSNQEICSGTAPKPLTGTASTGGITIKNYKWQSSTISATGPWTPAQAYSTTATGFSPGTLTTTTYYRRMDSSGVCLGVPTASVTITVDAPPIAGTISSNAETCANTTPAPFTGTPSTGGTASKYYKWQRSTGSASGPWMTVQAFNTTATDYAPTTPVILVAYYRRVDSSGACPNVETNTISIKTKAKYPVAPITSLVRDTLCVGENFQLIPHTSGPGIPFSANGGFYFTWKKVQGGTTTTVVPTSLGMQSFPAIPVPATLADSGTYYLIYQDGATTMQCRDSVKIVIRINQPPTQKSLIQSNQELCLNTAASALTEFSPATGFIGSPLNYQWHSTKDSTGTPTLQKIATATGNSYSPGVIPSTFYYVRKDSVKYCPAVASNFVKVRINNKPILDSIRATVNDTLCENLGDQFQLKGYVDSIAAGKASINGGYYFTWKKLQQPATVPVVVSAAGKYVDYPALSRPVVEADSGTYYLHVQDGAGATQCLDFITQKIVVSKTCVVIACVKPTAVSAKVASISNDTLCVGNKLVLQKNIITLPATPPIYGYTYSWERSNTLGTVVVQAPSSTYQDLTVASVAPIDSGRYQLIVKDGPATPAACSESSAPISIVIHSPVTPASIGKDTIICKGNAVLPFADLTANTGGTGIYLHQWQSSTNNTTFTNISAATNTSYQSPTISSTTYFRRIDQSGVCGSVTSNTIKVDAYTGVIPGSISLGATTICYNTTPTQTILSTGVASGGTGGNGSETYQWQRSTDNTTWTPIAGTNTLTYKETNPLTATMYYRRAVRMGTGSCDTNFTSSVAINVYAPFTVGSIGSNQKICAGKTVALTETSTASGGGIANTQTYQWVESSDKGNTWVIAQGASTSKNYTSPVLSDSVWYKRVVISTCGQDSTNVVMIDVDTLSHPHASINTALTCQSVNISLTATASNAGTNPTYAWQKAPSIAGPWTTINGANAANYLVSNPQPADSGTVYKVIVTSSDVCNVGPDAATTVLKVQKTAQPKVTITTNLTGPACDVLPSITYSTTVQDQGTAPSYQWYNGTTNALIPGGTYTTYTPATAPINGDRVYVVMTSNALCPSATTAISPTFVLSLLPTPNPLLQSVDTSICVPGNKLLTATNTKSSGTTFQWHKNGTAINGATNTTYLVQYKDIPGGTYTFTESNVACQATAVNAAVVQMLTPPVVSAGNDIHTYKNSIVTLQGSVIGSTNYSWTTTTGLNNPNILNPSATISTTTTYTLLAKDATGLCEASSSVTVYIDHVITIPNVITPNGDGANDFWSIEHIEDYPNATFVVYNRWGNIVWKSENNSFEWNGTNYKNGDLLPDGTYFYIIDLKSPTYSEPITGYVQIIR